MPSNRQQSNKIMKVDELMNCKVSLYKRVNETNSMTITLNDWLHKVTPAAKDAILSLRKTNETDPKGAKAMKTVNLPCCTISGVFEGVRKASEVTYTNPIICIDIDEIPDGMTIEDLKKKVFELPYVFYVSLSARGEGLFALVHYNIEKSFIDIFKAIQYDFKIMGITIDKACKDICRLRFISWDSEPLEKEEVEMYDGEYIEAFADPRFYKEIKEERDTTLYIDDYFTYKTIKYLINNCGYRADNYDDWLMDGFRLATFNQYGHPLFMHLSQHSDNFNERVAERKWEECVRTTQMSKDCLAYYYAEAKRRLGSDWRRIIQKS